MASGGAVGVISSLLAKVEILNIEDIISAAPRLVGDLEDGKTRELAVKRLLRGLISFTPVVAANSSTLLFLVLVETGVESINETVSESLKFINHICKSCQTKAELFSMNQGILLFLKVIIDFCHHHHREAEIPWEKFMSLMKEIHKDYPKLRRIISEISSMNSLHHKGEELMQKSLIPKNGLTSNALERIIIDGKLEMLFPQIMRLIARASAADDEHKFSALMETILSVFESKPKAISPLLKGILVSLKDAGVKKSHLLRVFIPMLSGCKIPTAWDLTFISDYVTKEEDSSEYFKALFSLLAMKRAYLVALLLSLGSTKSRRKFFKRLFHSLRKAKFSLMNYIGLINACCRLKWWHKESGNLCTLMAKTVLCAPQTNLDVKQFCLTFLHNASSHDGGSLEILEKVAQTIIDSSSSMDSSLFPYLDSVMGHLPKASTPELRISLYLCILDICLDQESAQEIDMILDSLPVEETDCVIFELFMHWLHKPFQFFRIAVTDILKTSSLVDSKTFYDLLENTLLQEDPNIDEDDEEDEDCSDSDNDDQDSGFEISDNDGDDDVDDETRNILHPVKLENKSMLVDEDEIPLDQADEDELSKMDAQLSNIFQVHRQNKNSAKNELHSHFHFKQRLLDWIEIALQRNPSYDRICYLSLILLRLYFGKVVISNNQSLTDNLAQELGDRTKKLLSMTKAALSASNVQGNVVSSSKIISYFESMLIAIRKTGSGSKSLDLVAPLVCNMQTIGYGNDIVNVLWKQFKEDEKSTHSGKMLNLLSAICKTNPILLQSIIELPDFKQVFEKLRQRTTKTFAQLLGWVSKTLANNPSFEITHILEGFKARYTHPVSQINCIKEEISILSSFLYSARASGVFNPHLGQIKEILACLRNQVKLFESKCEKNQLQSLNSRLHSLEKDWLKE